MERISTHISEAQAELINQLHEATWESDSIPRIDSKSEIIRLLLDAGLGAVEEGSADLGDVEISDSELRELIPDHTILDHRREQHKAEAKPLFRGSKIAERFSDKADELFSGEHGTKATPRTVEEIGESYLAELEDLDELDILEEESIERQTRAIRERIERYKREYDDAEFAPAETMRDVPEEVSIGSQIKRLRSERERFLRSLKSKAETEQYSDPSDLLKALAYEHGVEERAIELVIDAITPEGSEGRQALKNGSGVELPEEIRAIEDPDLIERALDDVDPSVGDSAEDRDLDHVPRNGDQSPAGATIELAPEEVEELETDGGER
jgi:hypothetical protein